MQIHNKIDYNLKTAELVYSLLQGMLIKPEDFDPNKKYPMIVNFYEKRMDYIIILAPKSIQVEDHFLPL